MKGVYNKEALNRIASQDRLDRMIVLVSPSVWIAIAGGFILIAALLVWGFLGKLPTSVDVNGMFMNIGGMSHIQSVSNGFVTGIYVEDGDIVHNGDIIASLGTEDDVFQIRQIDNRIQYVENMTFDSEMDDVTSDTEKMAQIKMNAKTSGAGAKKTEANLELKKEKLRDAEKLVKEKENLMLQYKEKYFATLSITDQKEQVAYNEASEDYSKHFSLYEQYKSTYISIQEQYYTRKNDFDSKYSDFDTTTATEEQLSIYNSALADVESARTQAGDAKYFMEDEEKKVRDANSTLDAARKAYLEYLNDTSGVAATNVVAQTEYSEALQDYETSKQIYKNLIDEIDNLELQSVLDEGDAELDLEKYMQEFDNEKSIVLHDLQRQRESLLHKTENGDLMATDDGVVYDILVDTGDAVSVGTEIARLLYGDLDENSVICYVPIVDVKKLSEGMEAHIFPTSVDKDEYGHIIGKVTRVENHVESNYDMLGQLGDQSLVNEFMQKGAVQKVTLQLNKDETTKSGYQWNSKKGADVALSTGTMVSATIITENKRPIDILIPYLKHKLEFDEDENGTNLHTNAN